MSDISTWSETDASNTIPANSGMPEGMARSDVNNRVREHMGAIRRWYGDADWIDPISGYGDEFTVSRVNTTTFRVTDVSGSGTDASSKYPQGTWVKLVIGGVTRYGRITSTTYSAPATDVVLADIQDEAYSSAGTDGELPAGLVTLAATFVAKRIRAAAFSPTGATTGQSPPEIPTIDDLGTAAVKAEGHTADDSGINADRLDGFHASELTTASLTSRESVLKNGGFSTWSLGSSNWGANDLNGDDLFADCWYFTHEVGSGLGNIWSLERTSVQGDIGSHEYAVLLTSTSSALGNKVGLVQTVPSESTRPLVGSGSASLSFQIKMSTGAATNSISAFILEANSATPADPINPITAWGAQDVAPTIGNGWTVAGQVDQADITDAWSEVKIDNATIASDTVLVAVLIVTDQPTTVASDELYVTGVQLQAGDQATDYVYDIPKKDETFWESSTNLGAVASGALPTNFSYTEAHTLKSKPRLIRAVFRCISADVNYQAGDEIDLASTWRDDNSGGDDRFGWSFGADTSGQVFLVCRGLNEWRIPNKTTPSSWGTPDLTKWDIYIYAWA